MCGLEFPLSKAVSFPSLLDHDSWMLLASAIHLLAYCELRGDPSINIDQLCYLSSGEGYFQELDTSNALPRPACVPDELWQSLHRAPLATAYFSEMIECAHSSPEFWQGLQAEGEVEVSKFPWKKNGAAITLDDLVFLRCVNKEATLERLEQQVSSECESVSVPLISEVFLAAKCGPVPVVFLYDENSAVSQANLQQLEDELRKALEVQL